MILFNKQILQHTLKLCLNQKYIRLSIKFNLTYSQQNHQNPMSQFYQERVIVANPRRKSNISTILPQIKYSPQLPKKTNDDLFSNNKAVYNFQPLSNVLLSKKLAPTNPQQLLLISKKRSSQNPTIHQYYLRKQTVKKITSQGQQQNNQQQKRNGTSLSSRKLANNFLIDQRIYEDFLLNKIKQDALTYSVASGNNNEDLIRAIMNQRKIWKQIKYGEGVPNFKWVFYKDRVNYKKMWSYTKKKIINHFEFNQEICTKDNLVKNLQIYCQTKKIQLFTITPITFIINFDDQYCDYNMKQFLQFYIRNDRRKNSQNKNHNPYNFVSKFHGYMSWQNEEIRKKVNILSRPIHSATYYSDNSYLWLLKPTGLNRGRGIQIFDSLQQLQKILLQYLSSLNRKKIKDKVQQKEKGVGQEKDKMQKSGSTVIQIESDKPEDCRAKQHQIQQLTNQTKQKQKCSQKFTLKTCSFVIQKYVQRPFLIHDRKFDIRVWALLTQSMNVYFFKQGYIRTSAQSFSTTNIDNYFIHLTNNAIQKYSSNYGQFQNANQLSFWNLKDYMGQNQVQRIWKRIKEITFMVFSSVKNKINGNQRKHCFQIFGLDYFIDSELKVWLIEVNQNPCIECSSPLLADLIPRMINDAFKLTIDQIITEKKPQEKAYPVKGYPDNQNMWGNLGQLMPNSQYSVKQIPLK